MEEEKIHNGRIVRQMLYLVSEFWNGNLAQVDDTCTNQRLINSQNRYTTSLNAIRLKIHDHDEAWKNEEVDPIFQELTALQVLMIAHQTRAMAYRTSQIFSSYCLLN